MVSKRKILRHGLPGQGRKQKAQFVLPSTQGLKPVTRNMDDFVRENHPNLDACFADALALETVEGQREYKPVTG